jgi:ribose transport system permease protein
LEELIMSNSSGVNFSWKRDVVEKFYSLIQILGVFLFIVILMSIFLPNFFSIINITNLLRQLSVNLIVAAGMTFIILTGEFDLSVGSVLALTAAIAGQLIFKFGVVTGCLLALLVGVLFGLFNGFIVTKGQIPSFICTLGTMMMARSLAFVVTEGRVLSGFPDAFKVIGQGSIGGFPIAFVIVIVLYAIGYIVLRKTIFGKRVYAVGADKKVAMMSGINTDRTKIQSFVIVGLFASLGGIVLLSRLAAIQADTGKGLEFDVIAAVVIGGTSMFGGEGNILQTIIGVIIIGLIRNFLNLAHISIFWQDFATGVIIIIAVLLDTMRKRIAVKI